MASRRDGSSSPDTELRSEIDRLTLGAGDLVGAEDRPTAQSVGCLEHAASVVEQLRVALAALDETSRACGGDRRARIPDQRSEILAAQAQLAVERKREV